MTSEQLELLEMLVDAYWSNQPDQGKETFWFSGALGEAGVTMQHPSFGEEERPVDVGDIGELESLGLVAVNWRSPMEGDARPTADGKRKVEEQRRVGDVIHAETPVSSGGGSGIGWNDTLPILKAVVDLYPDAPPGFGVSQGQVSERLGRAENDLDTGRKFEMLEQAGYIKGMLETDQTPGPLMAVPTEKALSLLAGWPTSGAAAVERLLSILDERIEDAPNEQQKGKLRALRDSVIDIGEGVAAEVLVKLMMG